MGTNNTEKLSTSLSEAAFLRMRPANFMGSEFPQNIWCKEAIDNCTDIITEGLSTQAKFMIMDDGRSIVQMDNGTGISTRQCLDANGVKSTYLYNSIHKLYAGSNYGDESLPPRGAWIEIIFTAHSHKLCYVAPPAGSVD